MILINLAILLGLLGLLELGIRTLNHQPKSEAQLTLPGGQQEAGSSYGSFKGLPGIRPVPDKYQDNFSSKLSKYPNQLLDKTYSQDFYTKNVRKAGDYQATAKIKNTDVIVFDVTYKIDEFGRRYVENQEEKKDANRFLLTFGCSFTFGEGLAQGHDYPSQLAEKLDSTWKVYNFGEIGAGPNDFLDRLRTQPEQFLAGIKEDEGVWIWNFHPDHLVRFLCPWICYSSQYSWIQPKTEYILEGHSLITRGLFQNSRDPIRLLSNSISKSHIVQSVGFRIPPLYTPYEFDLFIKGLNEISNSLKNRNIKKKYVLIDRTFKGYPIFKSLLKRYDFEPVEMFHSLKQIKMKHTGIPADGHPSAEFNWYLSELIKNRIENDFQ